MKSDVKEVVLKIYKDEDGVWCAAGVDHRIYTFGKTWNRLWNNIRDAVECYFEVPYTDVNIILKLEARESNSAEITTC